MFATEISRDGKAIVPQDHHPFPKHNFFNEIKANTRSLYHVEIDLYFNLIWQKTLWGLASHAISPAKYCIESAGHAYMN